MNAKRDIRLKYASIVPKRLIYHYIEILLL